MKTRKTLFTLSLILLASVSRANISLPEIFSDHMVLQQESIVSIWGWGKPNEEIRITGSWDPGREYKLKVDNQSFWSIELETPEAGGPYRLSLEGFNTIVIEDILVGEVWLGSGQSNMEWTPAAGINRAKEEISAADYPEIRFFTALTETAANPQQHLAGEWVVCTPETMKDFSALMYFFGRELHSELNVPVGLINSSWGGTPIEIWMSESCVAGNRLLAQNAKLLKPVPWGPIKPGSAYNAMIYPLIPYRIKGSLWYQGESNVDHPELYAKALTTLVDSWRASWGYDFPFYYVQIAPWSGYGKDNVNGAIMRDQQRMALNLIEKSGMVVISDIGNLENIHPENKQDVGIRLASWALNQDYGFSDRKFSGPLYSHLEVRKDKLIIHFDHADDGLMALDGDLREFEVLSEDGIWVEASAEINKEVVEIVSPVDDPQGVRFAFRNDSDPNLYNRAGLPASCFEILMNPLKPQP